MAGRASTRWSTWIVAPLAAPRRWTPCSSCWSGTSWRCRPRSTARSCSSSIGSAAVARRLGRPRGRRRPQLPACRRGRPGRPGGTVCQSRSGRDRSGVTDGAGLPAAGRGPWSRWCTRAVRSSGTDLDRRVGGAGRGREQAGDAPDPGPSTSTVQELSRPHGCGRLLVDHLIGHPDPEQVVHAISDLAAAARFWSVTTGPVGAAGSASEVGFDSVAAAILQMATVGGVPGRRRDGPPTRRRRSWAVRSCDSPTGECWSTPERARRWSSPRTSSWCWTRSAGVAEVSTATQPTVVLEPLAAAGIDLRSANDGAAGPAARGRVVRPARVVLPASQRGDRVERRIRPEAVCRRAPMCTCSDGGRRTR